MLNKSVWRHLEDEISVGETSRLILSDEIAMEGIEEIEDMLNIFIVSLPRKRKADFTFVLSTLITSVYAFGYRRGRQMANMPEFIAEEGNG